MIKGSKAYRIFSSFVLLSGARSCRQKEEHGGETVQKLTWKEKLINIIFGKGVTNIYVAHIVWIFFGLMVCISQKKKIGSYSPGERGPGAGPSGAGAIIISWYFCYWSILLSLNSQNWSIRLMSLRAWKRIKRPHLSWKEDESLQSLHCQRNQPRGSFR